MAVVPVVRPVALPVEQPMALSVSLAEELAVVVKPESGAVSLQLVAASVVGKVPGVVEPVVDRRIAAAPDTADRPGEKVQPFLVASAWVASVPEGMACTPADMTGIPWDTPASAWALVERLAEVREPLSLRQCFFPVLSFWRRPHLRRL